MQGGPARRSSRNVVLQLECLGPRILLSTAFGSQQAVTTSADGAMSVYATDLDADGDPDILSASYYDDRIAWQENLGGGSFGTQHGSGPDVLASSSSYDALLYEMEAGTLDAILQPRRGSDDPSEPGVAATGSV